MTKNCLVPGLLIFCVLDMVDEDEEFFHHGYQLLYTGNVQLALDDKLTVTVIDPTAIEVVMPAVSDAFLKNFDDYISIAK